MFDPERLKPLITDTIWQTDLATVSRPRAFLVRVVRICWVLIRDFGEGQISLRAMSLVYTTLLSLVPLLAISFSVLKGFGVHNQIEPFLLNFLAPLGEKGIEIGTRIIEFVENVKAGVLGSIGLGLLVYTVVSLMQKIERAFNFIWHVPHQRPFAQRFSGYLSVIVIGPVLVFSSLGITASLTSTSVVAAIAAIEPFGRLIRIAGSLVPYVLVVGAFTFIYMFMPNTRVRFSAALLGAAVAGALWNTAGWAFASFVVTSTKYTAIYSAFAALIIFMIWLYVSWLILLFGATIGFYFQHPEYLLPGRNMSALSIELRERIALAAAAEIAARFYDDRPPPTTDDLALCLRMAVMAVSPVLDALGAAGIVTRSAGDPPRWIPARPPDQTPVRTLLNVIRSDGMNAALSGMRMPKNPVIDDAIKRLDGALDSAFEGLTLKDIALPGPKPAAGESDDATEMPTRIGAAE